MTPGEYERLVAELKAAFVKEVDGLAPARVGVGATNHITGASGFPHQIDVSLDLSAELHLIECKRWESVVDPEAILAFVGRVKDIAEARQSQRVTGAMVTTTGFGPGAAQVAAHFGVVLEVVKSSREFVIRYRDRISAGVTDGATVRDAAVAEVRPARPDRSGHDSGAA